MKKTVAPGVVIPPSHSMQDLPSGQSVAPPTRTSWIRKVLGSKRNQRSTNNASMAMALDHNTFGEDLAVMSYFRTNTFVPRKYQWACFS
jgi:hypothetical protein